MATRPEDWQSPLVASLSQINNSYVNLLSIIVVSPSCFFFSYKINVFGSWVNEPKHQRKYHLPTPNHKIYLQENSSHTSEGNKTHIAIGIIIQKYRLPKQKDILSNLFSLNQQQSRDDNLLPLRITLSQHQRIKCKRPCCCCWYPAPSEGWGHHGTPAMCWRTREG